MILKANAVLTENEEYLNNIKIKEAKKRTAQEAELLGVDMTYTSIKQYRSEVLIDVSNAKQSEQAKSHNSHQTSVSSTQHELNEPSAKSITMEKNQKTICFKFIIIMSINTSQAQNSKSR